MYELGIEHACILLSSTLTIVKDASVYLRHYRWCFTWVTRQVMSHLSGTTSVVSPEWHYRWCLTWLYLQVMSYPGDYRWCLTWVTLQMSSHLSVNVPQTLQVFWPECTYRCCLTWVHYRHYRCYFLHILLCHTFNRALKYYFTNPSSGQTSMFWSILWLSGNQRNICSIVL